MVVDLIGVGGADFVLVELIGVREADWWWWS